MEAMEYGGSLIIKLQEGLKSFGWCGVGAEEVHGLSSGEMNLACCSQRWKAASISVCSYRDRGSFPSLARGLMQHARHR